MSRAEQPTFWRRLNANRNFGWSAMAGIAVALEGEALYSATNLNNKALTMALFLSGLASASTAGVLSVKSFRMSRSNEALNASNERSISKIVHQKNVGGPRSEKPPTYRFPMEQGEGEHSLSESAIFAREIPKLVPQGKTKTKATVKPPKLRFPE